MASTVPRGVVRLEAEADMGLDSVVTLALGLGTGGTAEKRLRSDPRPKGVPSMEGLWSKGTNYRAGFPPRPPGAPQRVEGNTKAL